MNEISAYNDALKEYTIMKLKSNYLKIFRVACDDLCEMEEASLVRQRSVSCPDISKSLLVDS